MWQDSALLVGAHNKLLRGFYPHKGKWTCNSLTDEVSSIGLMVVSSGGCITGYYYLLRHCPDRTFGNSDLWIGKIDETKRLGSSVHALPHGLRDRWKSLNDSNRSSAPIWPGSGGSGMQLHRLSWLKERWLSLHRNSQKGVKAGWDGDTHLVFLRDGFAP